MSTHTTSTINATVVSKPVVTVLDLTRHLQRLIAQGQGDLPVFASDARACYPFQVVETETAAGYPGSVLLQPQPHLHVAEVDAAGKPAAYFHQINLDADRVRATCGAFA